MRGWWMVSLLSLFVGVAQATSLQRLEPSELAWIADLVVEAEVVGAQVERVEGQDYLRTVWTIRVDRVVKGGATAGDEVDVLVLGGARGQERTDVAGAPRFAPGERVVVFLEEREGGYGLVGFGQGKLTLIEEPGTGRDVLVTLRPPEGLERFDEAAVQLPVARRYADDFLGQLQDEIDAGFVPPYQPVAGLAPAKDRRYRAAALAAGQRVDPRYFDPAFHPTAAGDPAALRRAAEVLR